MKCPHCNSQMFVHNESENGLSTVVFYRCSVCVGEHVSSVINFEAQDDKDHYLEKTPIPLYAV